MEGNPITLVNVYNAMDEHQFPGSLEMKEFIQKLHDAIHDLVDELEENGPDATDFEEIYQYLDNVKNMAGKLPSK